MSVSKDKSNLFEGDIYSSIVNSIKIDNIIPKKGIKNSNNICLAAKKHATKEASLDDLINARTVLLLEEPNDGKKVPTYSSYTLCTRSPSFCNNTLCYSHNKMSKDNLKIFTDLKNTIIPEVSHVYYKNMGTRGAKKKNNKSEKNLIKNSNDSFTQNINNILSSGDKKLINILEDCASKINYEFNLNKDSLSSSIKNSKVNANANSNANANTNANSNANSNANANNDSDSDNEEVNFTNNDSENENNNSKDISNIIIKDNDNNSDIDDDLESINNISENNSDDEDGLVAEEIKTINGRKFYVDENSIVYEPIEDSFNVVGNLIIIDKKYKQIEYNNKDYSIFTKEIKNGKEFFKCFLTDKKFDTDMKYFK